MDCVPSDSNYLSLAFFFFFFVTVPVVLIFHEFNFIEDCGVGIAPEVTMSSCIVGLMDREEMLVYRLDTFDISQNSWAYEGCGRLSQYQLNRRNLQEDSDNINTNTNTNTNECIFEYTPFEGYLLSPCDKCNFTNPEELGQECIEAISNHCDWYTTQEREACMEYLDLILLRANPNSKGECHFGVLPEEAIEAFTKGVTEGRDGKGIIYVFAAGNEFGYGDNTNFQGYGANTRFSIAVAAIGKPGKISSFSTPGASVFVAAPGGDFHQSVTPIVHASNGGTCTEKTDGTSFAAPVVSGVVALVCIAFAFVFVLYLHCIRIAFVLYRAQEFGMHIACDAFVLKSFTHRTSILPILL